VRYRDLLDEIEGNCMNHKTCVLRGVQKKWLFTPVQILLME
jgi:hypothetical protein